MEKLLKAAPAIIGALKSAKLGNFLEKSPKAAKIARNIGLGSAAVGGAVAYDAEGITAIIGELALLIGAITALIAQLQKDEQKK